MGRSEGQDVLQRPIAIGLTLVSIWMLSACTSYPPEVPPGLDLSTPRQTTAYLRWAFENKKPNHVFNCLSTSMVERENLSQGNVETFWSDVEDWFQENVGEVADIRVENVNQVSPSVCYVDLRTKRNRATARFVLVCTWEVVPSGLDDAADGNPSSLSKVARIDPTTRQLTITLPLLSSPKAVRDIYLIRVENFWKLDDLIDSDLKRPNGGPTSYKDPR